MTSTPCSPKLQGVWLVRRLVNVHFNKCFGSTSLTRLEQMLASRSSCYKETEIRQAMSVTWDLCENISIFRFMQINVNISKITVVM